MFITDDAAAAARVREAFERQIPGVPLVVVESPYRALVGPLLAYLDVLDAAWPPDKPSPITFVVIPEYVARSWWERILYNQSSKRLRTVLLGRPHTVVVAVPYRREDSVMFEPAHGGIGPAGPPTPPAPPRLPGPCRASGQGSRGPADRATSRWYRDWPVQITIRRPSAERSSRSTAARSDERIVRLVADQAHHLKADLVAVHVVEVDLDPAARCRHRRAVGGGPARP